MPSCLARYWSISSSWTWGAEKERGIEEEEEEEEDDEMDGRDADVCGVAVSITSPVEEEDAVPDGNRNNMSPCLQKQEQTEGLK